jgi:hypothetical protein
MHNPPSDRCRDCPWWYEGAIMCLGCPNYPEAEKYILPCSQCRQFFYVRQLHEIVFEKKGLFLFCGKKCKDNWASSVTAEKHPVLEK